MAHLEMEFMRVCDGSCVAWEVLVLSVFDTFQSELGWAELE